MESANPQQHRYYFAGGDHWVVREENDGETIALERKRYSWWQFFKPCFVLPTIMWSIGVIHYFATGQQQPCIVITIFSVVVACLLVAFYRIEWFQLSRQPARAFAWRPNGVTEVIGKTFEASLHANAEFEYTFFQRGTLPGSGSFSELNLLVGNGVHQRRFNLLAQKSNWALKHARKLHELTEIPLKRKVVVR